jgi:signal transduction histidine kinase
MPVQVLVIFGVYFVGFCITVAIGFAIDARQSKETWSLDILDKAFVSGILWPVVVVLVLVFLFISLISWVGELIWYIAKVCVLSPIAKMRLKRETLKSQLINHQKQFESEGIKPFQWMD